MSDDTYSRPVSSDGFDEKGRCFRADCIIDHRSLDKARREAPKNVRVDVRDYLIPKDQRG